jgi:hypothetical protein
VRFDFCSIGAGKAIFVEPLDSRGEAMGAPPLIPRFQAHYTLPCAAWHRIIEGVVDVSLKATVHETSARVAGKPEVIQIAIYGSILTRRLLGSLASDWRWITGKHFRNPARCKMHQSQTFVHLIRLSPCALPMISVRASLLKSMCNKDSGHFSICAFHLSAA